MKALGWMFKITLGLILMIAIGLGVLIATFDANDYRDKITQLVEKQTGRQLTIDNLELAFFPRLGLNLENATLSNAPGFKNQPFLQVKQVQVGVAIMPLFQQKLEIDTLTLSGLKLNLERNATGANNWDDLIKSDQSAEQTPPTPSHDAASSSNPLDKLASLQFGGLDIKKADISWDDRQSQQAVLLKNVNLSSGAITFGEFFPIKLSADTQLKNPDMALQLTLAIEAQIHQDGRYALRNLSLETRATGAGLPLDTATAELTLPTLNLALKEQRIAFPDLAVNYGIKGGNDFPIRELNGDLTLKDFKLNLATQQLNLPSLTLNYDGQGQGDLPIQALQGQLSASGLVFYLDKQQLTLPSLKLTTQNTGQNDFVAQQMDLQLSLTQLLADLKQQTFKADNLALQGHLQGDQLPKGSLKVTASVQPQANLQKQTAQLKALHLEAMDIKADGHVQTSQFLDAPKVTASLKVPQTNLRTLLNDLKIALPEMSDPKTLTRLAAAFKLDYDGGKKAVKISNLNVQLDDSQLTGTASVAQFEQPDIRWDLSLNQIDLNRYLPPKADATSQPTEPQTPPVSNEDPVIELPVELLRSLTLNGTLKAGDIRFDKLNPKNLVVVVKGKPGLIQVSQLTTDIFKTQFKAQASLDVRGAAPKYTFKTDTQKLPVQELLITFADTDQLSGTGHVQADIITQGDRVSQFKQHLNGTVKLDLKDGSVKGFNLAQSVREAKAMISGQKASAHSEPLKTDFTTLVMHANIHKGVITTDTLKAAAPYMRIRGEGDINLPKETLDYHVYTSLVGTSKGQGGDDLKDLDGLTIPIKLNGNFKEPKVSLDLESLLRAKAQQEVQKQLDEQKEKLQKEAQKKIEEQLKEQLGDQQEKALKELGDQLLKKLPF